MSGFRSTVSPPNVRRIAPSDAWLTDPTTGSPIGVVNQNANGKHGQFYPVPLTAAQIAAPTDEMLDDTDVTYALNVAPFTRYMSDGTSFTQQQTAGSTFGIASSQSTIPAGSPLVTIDQYSQAVVYAPLTVESTAGLEVQGELRVYTWPA
ncbi:MAG: hypothetical protein Q8R92_19820 [Deltaproteobacteria bacterium]|nr:hypothetical protein [Deltaproteobacteria bacterium]